MDSENLQLLQANDQLIQLMAKNEIFTDFHEENILFPPTYKFLLSTPDFQKMMV